MENSNFESKWTIRFDGLQFTLITPDQSVNTLAMKDLKGIFIETDDSGPFGSDVRWYLAGNDYSLVFPQGSTGEKELLSQLQTLEGFNNQELIRAMQSTDNQMFILWKR